MTRDVELRVEQLATGDVVVSRSGAAWKVEVVTAYEDRDGKHQVAATGRTRAGQQFALLRQRHYPVTVRLPR